MSSDIHYHKQPHTLDPNQEPVEDDAPRAQGHTEEDASDVREAMAEHKETVEAEAEQDEVGPRDVGDHAGEADQDPDRADDDSCPPNGTVEEVKAWVGDDPDRARQALEAERSGLQRSTLIAHLETVANG